MNTVKKKSMTEDIKTNLAEIRTQVEGLIKTVDYHNDKLDQMVERLNVRISTVEVTQAKHGERLSNLTVFQTTLSVIIGAVATYLGATIKK